MGIHIIDWQNEKSWRGLMALLLVVGLTWIMAGRTPLPMPGGASAPPPAPAAGFIAPDFTLPTLEGELVTLNDLRGQAVVINFWASWCPPCRTEMPSIEAVYQQYKDQGLVVLAVDIQEPVAAVATFVDSMELTFPILLDADGSISQQYQVRGLPSTFFVDRQGVIRNVAFGGPMARAFIESQVVALMAEEQ